VSAYCIDGDAIWAISRYLSSIYLLMIVFADRFVPYSPDCGVQYRPPSVFLINSGMGRPVYETIAETAALESCV